MVDCCSAPGLTPVDQALDQLLSALSLDRLEHNVLSCQIEQALGQVLAQDVQSQFNIPALDNSAMDGYALKSEDAQKGNSLTMVAKVFAGHPIDQTIQAGECARIMTGAPVPAGCDTVIMQENVSASQDGEQIVINQAAKAGENIRRAGEDISTGQVVLKQGRRLTPADIGLLASLGFAEVRIYKPLTVAIISTGDELKKPGQSLKPGQFFESNGYTVKALLQRLNVDVLDFGIIEDDLDKLRQAFTQADEQADVVITSGGVSVGEADYTKTVLDELGKINFWKLAIKPGKPFAFGELKNSYFIGLPGNPVSAMVTLHQLGGPMLRKLSGEAEKAPLRLQAKTTNKLRKRPGRTDFQRGIYQVNDSGQLEVQATGNQGSGILSSMSFANCYIILEQERGPVEAGETVTIEPFDSLIA